MHFLIADTFTDSLARLTADEQKATKTTAFDLQVNPAHPGLSFHKLDKARDKHFWSVRVSRDVRMIVHRTESSLLLCYADHHDKAYHWAERRRLETHPTTGAAQLVEIRERIQEVIVPKAVEQVQTILPLKPKLFLGIAESALLAYGVPQEWIADVQAADEDSLLTLADHLPSEAAEALLELATGGKPKTAPVAVAGKDPFEHPDAQRRFRVMGNAEELERALAAPWDKWIVFLHPEQRELVQRDYNGPARVSGSAGTGKTIVALHRAVHLARSHSEARVLLTTFSDPLAQSLRNKLRKLIGSEPRLAERIEVQALNALGARLYEGHVARPTIADRDRLRALLIDAAQAEVGLKFSERFLLGEWEDVVDAWQLESWESYRDVRRLGRKTRLPEVQRKSLWSVFERVRASLATEGLITTSQMFHRLAAELGKGKSSPYDFAVVDESQDIDIAQLRFLAALGAQRPNALFFAGDLGQRIFQQPFSWKSVGVDIRGRSRTLHINYRTSHQIRAHADRLLGPEVSDVDGNVEERGGTVSVFNGMPPQVLVSPSEAEEITAVANWLKAGIERGLSPQEIGVIVRSEAQLGRADSAIGQAGLKASVLDQRMVVATGAVSVCTMHLAKGLEFRAVVVMACDDEVIPLQERIESVSDDADLEEVYDTERHLLYVACTRARDSLLVTAVAPASEFLQDMLPR